MLKAVAAKRIATSLVYISLTMRLNQNLFCLVIGWLLWPLQSAVGLACAGLTLTRHRFSTLWPYGLDALAAHLLP